MNNTDSLLGPAVDSKGLIYWVHLKDVIQATGLSRSTILRGIAAKKFPAPARFGSTMLFNVQVINDYMKSLQTNELTEQ